MPNQAHGMDAITRAIDWSRLDNEASGDTLARLQQAYTDSIGPIPGPVQIELTNLIASVNAGNPITDASDALAQVILKAVGESTDE